MALVLVQERNVFCVQVSSSAPQALLAWGCVKGKCSLDDQRCWQSGTASSSLQGEL